MAMQSRITPIQFVPKTVEGTRIFVPQSMQKRMDLLVDGISHREQLGEFGFFGTMFHGMQGTGKTLHVRHIAEKTNALLFEAPLLSDAGDVEALYTAARAAAKDRPVIVLCNDIDYVGKRSEGSINHQFRPVLAKLLTEMESAENKGVFTFVTSNEPDIMDDALRRPPRVTFEFEFLPPTRLEREKILEAILSNDPMEIVWPKEMVSLSADITFGFVPGDLFGIIQCASIHAIARGSKEVSREDVLSAKAMQKPSAIRDMPFIEPTETLNDFAGRYVSSQKMMLSELAARIDSGVVLLAYGPSGCGKTGLARAVVGSFKFNGILYGSNNVLDKYVGESAKKLAKAFDRAKALAPTVLIIDQAEGIINPGNQYSDDWVSVLKSRLSEPIPGVMVILTATNPSGWDPEILGRCHKMYVGAPDASGLLMIANKLLPQGHPVDLPKVFEQVGHLSVRELKTAIRKITDFGGTFTTELLTSVLKTYPEGAREAGFEHVVQKIGDDTAMFREIKSAGRGA